MPSFCGFCGSPVHPDGTCTVCGRKAPDLFAPPAPADEDEATGILSPGDMPDFYFDNIPDAPAAPTYPTPPPFPRQPDFPPQPDGPAYQAPTWGPPTQQQASPVRDAPPYPAPTWQPPAFADPPTRREPPQPSYRETPRRTAAKPADAARVRYADAQKPAEEKKPTGKSADKGRSGSRKGLAAVLIILVILLLSFLTVYLLNLFGVITITFLQKEEPSAAQVSEPVPASSDPSTEPASETAAAPAVTGWYLARLQKIKGNDTLTDIRYTERGKVTEEIGVSYAVRCTFDGFGRIETEDMGPNGRVTYTYEPNGDGFVGTGDYTSLNEPGPQRRTLYYNGVYQLTRAEHYFGSEMNSYILYEYYASGRIKQKTEYTVLGGASQVMRFDERGVLIPDGEAPSNVAYDENGLPVREDYADGVSVLYTWAPSSLTGKSAPIGETAAPTTDAPATEATDETDSISAAE